MRLDEAVGVLKAGIEKRIPVMLWGPPGVGKSSIVAQTAAGLGIGLVDLRLAQLDATDLRGIPVPNRETRAVDWYPPAFLPREGRGVLFLDEIDKAPALVKNSALQLVLDRRLGDYSLPEGWAMVCAGNREEDNAFSSPLGAALANRMIHVGIEPDLGTWTRWARGNGIPEEFIGFLTFRPELLYKQTGENAFPSPRSWAMAARMIQRGEGIENPKSEISDRTLAVVVGASTAAEFAAWYKDYRKIDPAAVLGGPVPSLRGRDASFRYALVASVARYVMERGGKGLETGIRRLLDALTPELQVVFFRQFDERVAGRLAVHPEIAPIARKIVVDYYVEDAA